MEKYEPKFAVGARAFVFASHDELKKYDGREVVILRYVDDDCTPNNNFKYEVRLLYSNETFVAFETDLV